MTGQPYIYKVWYDSLWFKWYTVKISHKKPFLLNPGICFICKYCIFYRHAFVRKLKLYAMKVSPLFNYYAVSPYKTYLFPA